MFAAYLHVEFTQRYYAAFFLSDPPQRWIKRFGATVLSHD